MRRTGTYLVTAVALLVGAQACGAGGPPPLTILGVPVEGAPEGADYELVRLAGVEQGELSYRECTVRLWRVPLGQILRRSSTADYSCGDAAVVAFEVPAETPITEEIGFRLDFPGLHARTLQAASSGETPPSFEVHLRTVYRKAKDDEIECKSICGVIDFGGEFPPDSPCAGQVCNAPGHEILGCVCACECGNGLSGCVGCDYSYRLGLDGETLELAPFVRTDQP